MALKRHRSFAPKKDAIPDPLTFDLLEGKYEFECKPVLQGALILDFVAASEEGGASGAGHMLTFIHSALKDEEEVSKFEKVVHSEDPADNIDIEELGQIVAWLVEEYTSRPTPASSR